MVYTVSFFDTHLCDFRLRYQSQTLILLWPISSTFIYTNMNNNYTYMTDTYVAFVSLLLAKWVCVHIRFYNAPAVYRCLFGRLKQHVEPNSECVCVCFVYHQYRRLWLPLSLSLSVSISCLDSFVMVQTQNGDENNNDANGDDEKGVYAIQDHSFVLCWSFYMSVYPLAR